MLIRLKEGSALKLGFRVIDLINQNVASGVDVDGKPFKRYSDKWFARPAGDLSKAKSGRIAKLIKSGDARYFSGKSGATWLSVRGYRRWKLVESPSADPDDVNLTLTGNMLSAMQPNVNSDGSVEIGFANSEAAELAFYHNISGAGRSRVLRRFLGLQPQQWQDRRILELISTGLTIKV